MTIKELRESIEYWIEMKCDLEGIMIIFDKDYFGYPINYLKINLDSFILGYDPHSLQERGISLGQVLDNTEYITQDSIDIKFETNEVIYELQQENKNYDIYIKGS